ncbi:Hypothetical protein A7982_07057 [Minicystis rosea]|nr:Hypothetical protein A7982_07057 [Minicystis rosea]
MLAEISIRGVLARRAGRPFVFLSGGLMAFHLPLSVRLHRRSLARRDLFFSTLMRILRPPPSVAGLAMSTFAFKNDEEDFARALLARHGRLWLYRSNQRAFCGDFVIVDMSSPSPAARRAFVVDLKQGAPLRRGGGGAGVQLRNAEQVIRHVGNAGTVLGDEAPWDVVTGDGARILEWLSARE